MDIKLIVESQKYKYDLEHIVKIFISEDLDIVISEDASLFCGKSNEDYVCVYTLESSVYIVCVIKNESVGLKLKLPAKNELKREVYKILSKFTGASSPYGILVGIRPVKIVHEIFDNGLTPADVKQILIDEYLITSEKADLLIEIALRERASVFPIDEKSVSIYISIPFCKSRCYYCSFPGTLIDKNEKLAIRYIKALEREIEHLLSFISLRGYKVDNLYIGGGTPSALKYTELAHIIGLCKRHIDFSTLDEFTVEAGRPDTLDREMLDVIENSGASRICLNPQSMNDSTLGRIGRTHSRSDLIDIYRMIDKSKIKVVNMDIIAGLDGETYSEFCNSIDEVVDVSPENITVHVLSVKRGSKLGELRQEYDMTLGTVVDKMLGYANNRLRESGYVPYYLYRQKNIIGNFENIGYAKPDFLCIYNMKIMTERNTFLGMGAGASSKFYTERGRFDRFNNSKGIHDYIERVDELIAKKKLLLSQALGDTILSGDCNHEVNNFRSHI